MTEITEEFAKDYRRKLLEIRLLGNAGRVHPEPIRCPECGAIWESCDCGHVQSLRDELAQL